MIFRGNYEVTREIQSRTLNVTALSTLHSLNVGDITVTATKTIDFGANRVLNLAEPTADTDAATKLYVDTNKTRVTAGAVVPNNATGSDEDIFFEGVTSGPRMLPNDLTGDREIASDGINILVLAKDTSGSYHHSTNDGLNFSTELAVANANAYEQVVSTSPGHFLMVRNIIGGTSFASSYTTDAGATWNDVTITSSTDHNLRSIIVDRNNSNTTVLLLRNDGLPLVSQDEGQTFEESAGLPAGDYISGAMYDNVVIISDAANRVFRSYDEGRTFSLVGNLPAIGATWNSMEAVSKTDFIAAGTGAASHNIIESTDAGEVWTAHQIFASAMNISSMAVNRLTGVISALGSDRLYHTTVNTYTNTWLEATIDTIAQAPTIVVPHNSGFVGVKDDATNIGISTDGSAWDTHHEAEYNKLYSRQAGAWVPLNMMSKADANKIYLNSSAPLLYGIMNANDNRITNVGIPLLDGDAVNKDYVDTVLSETAGEFIQRNISTVTSTVTTVPADVESFKLQLMAKVGTKRYYSEVNVIANGTDTPVSSEYSLMSIGDLDVEITVSLDGSNNTVVSATASEDNVEFRMKRFEINL